MVVGGVARAGVRACPRPDVRRFAWTKIVRHQLVGGKGAVRRKRRGARGGLGAVP